MLYMIKLMGSPA